MIKKGRLYFKYGFVVFITLMATAALVGGNFYYSVFVTVRESLSGIPGHEEILLNMNQIFYSQIVLLVVTSAGLSFIVSHIFASPAVRLCRHINNLKKNSSCKDLRDCREFNPLAKSFEEILKDRGSDNINTDELKSYSNHICAKLEQIKQKLDNPEDVREVENVQRRLRELASGSGQE